MAYISEASLRIRGTKITDRHIKLAKSLTDEKDVFLSYAQVDRILLRGAIDLLEELGTHPYVDEADPSLSALTTAPDKAVLLRDTIERCPRLILLLTEGSKESNWTPWEIGLADGFHGSRHVATLPLAKGSGSDEWGLREYLATYPQIQYLTLNGDPGPSFAVRDPENGKYWRFARWLTLTGR